MRRSCVGDVAEGLLLQGSVEQCSEDIKAVFRGFVQILEYGAVC